MRVALVVTQTGRDGEGGGGEWGCWVKWLEVKDERRLGDKWEAMCGGEECTDGQREGGIHTAVQGVDPGEPGQATSAEGLHPPFLSLAQSLCFFLISSLPLFLMLLNLCHLFFSFLSLKNNLHVAGRSKKNHLGKKMS